MIKKILTKYWWHLPSWKKISISLIAGIVAGITLGQRATIFKPIGIMFIHAIQMMIVPVVFTAIVCAVLKMHNSARVGKIWGKAILLYAISMMVASAIGIALSLLIKPGVGLHLDLFAQALPILDTSNHQLPSWQDVLIGVVPSNPIVAFSQANILQILVFAIVLGFSINAAGEEGRVVAKLFQSFSSVVFKLAMIIMGFAPYGIFALLAWVLGEFGLSILLPLMEFVGVVYLGCFVMIALYYSGVLLLYSRLNPIWFFKGIFSAAVVAFTTSSSAATLPQSLRCAEKNLGVPEKIAGFLLPLGTTLNLNGLSIYITVATLFSANIFAIHLLPSQYVTILLSTIIAAMGAAAVPGSALIVMGAVMASVGIPLGALPLIAGVDRFNDMAQTTTNVIGDLFAATVVAQNEHEIIEEDMPHELV